MASTTNPTADHIRRGRITVGATAAGAARSQAPAVALAALGVAALALLVLFDLGPPLSFNDDWMYAWAARRLAAGHVALYPASSALALTQIAWANLVTLGHTDQRLLRLTVVPFVALLSVSTYQATRRLGASGFWSATAALAVTASPVYLAGATSFMSDIPYTALVMAAVWNALRWQQDGKGATWTVVFACAATAQRQIGVFVVVALTLGWWLSRRRRPPQRRDWIGLAALWTGAVAAILVPHALGLTPAAASTRLAEVSAANPVVVAIDVLVAPAEIGLALIPFLAGLLTVHQASPAHDHRVAALIVLAGAAVVILVTHAGLPITGDSFQPMGLMDVQAANPQTKQLLYPWPLYELVMGLALVSFAAFAVWRWGAWRPTGVAGLTLLAVAIGQLVCWFVSPHFAYDRYYFPVAAPLVPLAALVADRSLRPQLAGWWAVGAVAFGLALYAVGEQDYQAWQYARDQAARLAYATTAPQYVGAGYEANAVYWELPHYDSTGIDVSGWSDPTGWDFAILGPRRPSVVIVFARADDPRPGFVYRSLASGKLVIQVVTRGGL